MVRPTGSVGYDRTRVRAGGVVDVLPAPAVGGLAPAAYLPAGAANDTDAVPPVCFRAAGRRPRGRLLRHRRRRGKKTIDLKAFYLSPAHRRWFFGTAATFSVLFIGTVNAEMFYEGDRTLRMAVLQTLFALPTLPVPALILIATRRRWVHWGLTLYSGGWVVYLLFDVANALAG